MILTIPPAVAPISCHDESRRASSAQRRLWRFCEEYVLGTRLEILVDAFSPAIANRAAHAARREIERLNLVFNHRRADSELSELNRVRRGTASADLFTVLQLGELWRRVSHGAFDGRMGRLLRLWATEAEPHRHTVEEVLAALREAIVTLDPINRGVELSSAIELSLDAIAKGYIVDAAFNAACRAAPAVQGLALSIGGDIRCWGASPDARGWTIGIPDPEIPAENAPLVDAVRLSNAAIATSGRGPRDCIGHRYRSTTISPFTGRPIGEVISATVVASHAADADAVATACLVLDPKESIALIERLDGVAARITDSQGRVHRSAGWQKIQLAATNSISNKPSVSASSEKKPSLPPEQRWPADWELGITYVEPDYHDQKRADFNTPYIAVWITDEENRPVNTVFMLGTAAKWHRDNFIWWDSNGARAEHLVELRSQGTSLSGRYRMYWSGVDDDYRPVPLGKYILHIETSQERNKHTHRALPIEIGRERFKKVLPNLQDEGGIEITYGHYNDRFKSED